MDHIYLPMGHHLARQKNTEVSEGYLISNLGPLSEREAFGTVLTMML